MSHAQQASKRKHRSKIVKAIPALGAAGLSLALAGGASASTGGPAGDMPTVRNLAPSHEIVLCEEELSDVSLGTFHVFDKENAPASRLLQLAAGRGCGCGGGCGRGCGGCGGRGCGCGGCGGYGLGLGLGLGLGYGLGWPYYGYGYGYPYRYGYPYGYTYPYVR